MTLEESKRLAKKWGKVLEMDIGKPITDPTEAKILATIIESQVKLNKSFFDNLEEEEEKRRKNIEKYVNDFYKEYRKPLTNKHKVSIFIENGVI